MSVPQTSNVTILLLTALIILAYKSISAISVEPGFVNAFTYTNLTIRGATKVQAVEGAVVDFNITRGDAIYLGLKPLRREGNVTLRVDNQTIRLGIDQACRIEIEAANMTSKISLNVTQQGCGDVRLYINGTKMPGLRVSYVPQYSGVYQVLATSGVFYEKTHVVVIPNITVSGNVYGEVMRILLTPPPRRASASLGLLAVSLREGVAEVDTWGLGTGNYTLRLYMSGVAVQVYPMSMWRGERQRLWCSTRPSTSTARG
jgi:hypothetical protein